MQMRVDKLLSQLQIATRSESKKLFQSGRVRVNDVVIKNGAFKCDPDADQIFVDEKQIVYQEFQYFMLYKPAGCVTATEDAHDKTVMDYLPAGRHRNLSPVGRLDKDTEGLLLITDDGALNHNLLAPGKHVEKTYFAVIEGNVTPDTVKRFKDGLDIGEKKPTAPAKLEILSSGEKSEERVTRLGILSPEEKSKVLVTITEGKFHQIKRMFHAVGMEVLYLKRLRMGTLCLDESLNPGECRELTAEEIQALKLETENQMLHENLYKKTDMLENKKAVIFDLDGTLADSMWVWSEIDQDFFRSRNMEFPADLDKKIGGMSFTETAQFFVDTWHLEDSVEELKDIWNQMAIEKYRTKIALKPGAAGFLDYLKEHHIKIGIATSNSNLLVDVFLKARHLDGYIDAITTGCDVCKGKPAPDVYLATASKLNVEPADCLVFEDIPMGILAGKNAGMTVCAVEDDYSSDLREEKRELADFYIEDFREILQ